MVQELRDHEDQLAREDFLVHLVSQVSQALTDCQEKRDHQVLGEDPVCLDCQDLRVHLVSQVNQVLTDCREKRDHQVLGEDQVCLVCQDLRVPLVQLGKKVNLVFQEL